MRNSPLMGRGERVSDLCGKADCLLQRQWSFCEALLQSFSLDQFHNEEVHATLVPDIMQGADVRMGEF
jgi:hypothetical protein